MRSGRRVYSGGGHLPPLAGGAVETPAVTLLGGGALAVLSLCSGITGLTLGVNPLNALVLGILGAPGLALLCALNVLTG